MAHRRSNGFGPPIHPLTVPGILCLLLLALVLGCSSPSPTTSRHYDGSSSAINRHISEASLRFDVPEPWIHAVMQVESGGRTHHHNGQPITSSAGAMGLMQVMPRTYAYLRDRYGLGHDPHNPRDNILAGTAYIREMYDLFGTPGFLAAYNAGPGRYSQHLQHGRPLPRETQRYVAMIYPQIAGILPGDARPDRAGRRSLSEYPGADSTADDHPG